MRLYRLRSSALMALAFSDDFLMGLEMFPETASLIPVVRAQHEQLDQSHQAVAALVKPRRAAKRRRDLSEYRAEKLVDEVAGACEAADDHTPRGPTSKLVFEDGVEPIKAPKGAAQVAALRGLVQKLGASKDARVMSVTAELGARLTSAAQQLEGDEKNFQDAWRAFNEASAIEDLRLSEHRRTMDSVLGALRSLFPGDSRKQNLIAPDVADHEPKKDKGDQPV